MTLGLLSIIAILKIQESRLYLSFSHIVYTVPPSKSSTNKQYSIYATNRFCVSYTMLVDDINKLSSRF